MFGLRICWQTAVAAACALTALALPGVGSAASSAVAPDKIPPTASIVSPLNGAVVRQGAVAYAGYYCEDAGGSGLASCAGTLATGRPFDTSVVGHHSVTLRAADGAGNVTTVTNTFEIVPVELGSRRADLAQIQAELQAMRIGLPGIWPRFYLERTLDSIGWASQPECWTATGELATTAAGYICLQAMRIVALRLFYANFTFRLTAEPQFNETNTLIQDIALDRFGEVVDAYPVPYWDWRASGPTAPLWSAKRDLDNALETDYPLLNTIAYIRSWHRLINFTPAHPA